jgi:MraZ protein
MKVERRSSGVSYLNPKVEHMFLGQYQHSLDAKGRMTIPAGYRDMLVGGAYITQGFDKNLNLLTESLFHEKAEKIKVLSDTKMNTRKLRRLFFSNAIKVEMDRLGRVLIPQFLRDIAELEKDAVIVGVGESIEIWSPTAWQQQLYDLGDSETTAQQFDEHDL